MRILSAGVTIRKMWGKEGRRETDDLGGRDRHWHGHIGGGVRREKRRKRRGRERYCPSRLGAGEQAQIYKEEARQPSETRGTSGGKISNENWMLKTGHKSRHNSFRKKFIKYARLTESGPSLGREKGEGGDFCIVGVRNQSMRGKGVGEEGKKDEGLGLGRKTVTQVLEVFKVGVEGREKKVGYSGKRKYKEPQSKKEARRQRGKRKQFFSWSGNFHPGLWEGHWGGKSKVQGGDHGRTQEQPSAVAG